MPSKYNLKKYEVLIHFASKKLLTTTTTVTTDKVLMEKWLQNENESKTIGFNVHTTFPQKKDEGEGGGFLNTWVISAGETALIFQRACPVHANNGNFKTPSLKLLNFLKKRILVGNNMEKKSYLAAIFGSDMNLLDIKDLTVDFPTYGATLKLEETVEKMLGMENRIGKCGWDSADFCRDEELVKYLTIAGQFQFELGKIYRD